MPWQAFEELVQALLTRLGYEDVTRSAAGGDDGVDLHAVLRAGDVANIEAVVQGKRLAGSVPPRVVRDLRGTLRAGQAGLVITTAHFSAAAKGEAEAGGMVPIARIDGPRLARMLVHNEIGVSHPCVVPWGP